MPAGDTLAVFLPLANEPPTSAYATLDVRNAQPVLDFDDTVIENAIFTGVMPQHFKGGGIDVTIAWAATTATLGDVAWTVEFEWQDAANYDLDVDGFNGEHGDTSWFTAPAAAGQIDYATISLTASDVEGISTGERFRLRITRTASDGEDDLVGDAELLSVELKEA